MNNFRYLKTIYDLQELRKCIAILNSEEIEFKSEDKSNQLNYRMPGNTYIEVDIFVSENNFEKAYELLATHL